MQRKLYGAIISAHPDGGVCDVHRVNIIWPEGFQLDGDPTTQVLFGRAFTAEGLDDTHEYRTWLGLPAYNEVQNDG